MFNSVFDLAHDGADFNILNEFSDLLGLIEGILLMVAVLDARILSLATTDGSLSLVLHYPLFDRVEPLAVLL